MENEDRGMAIYCPHCRKRVARWDGKSRTNVIAKCPKCRKQIVFYVDTGITKRVEAPKRHCSSGVTFT